MKLFAYFFLLALPLFSYGQKDTLFVQQIYFNVNTLTLKEAILEVPELDAKQLMLNFENYAGRTFMDYDNVRTAKTENFISLKYITSSFPLLKWYLGYEVDFKNGKVRLRINDLGNDYYPGDWLGNQRVNVIPLQSQYFRDYFVDGMIIHKDINKKIGAFDHSTKRANSLYALDAYLNASITRIHEALKGNTIQGTDNDW